MSLIAPSSSRCAPDERKIIGSDNSVPLTHTQTRDSGLGGSGAGDPPGGGATLTVIIQATGIDGLQVFADGGNSHFTPM